MVPLKTRILLADDHTIVRQGLRFILDAEPDLEVVAEVANGNEAVARALKDDIDLAILDIAMPTMTGLQAARELTARRPDLKMLILSMHDDEGYLFEALKAGTSGYVLKSVADRDLVEACRAAMRGEPFLYAGAERALVRDYVVRAAAGETPPEDPLTPREQQIVKLIAESHTNKQIAEVLTISEKTVETHRSAIMRKLQLESVADVVRYAVRNNIVQP